ncbi:MAG TPA: patatin-like phospholipase family protein [Bacillota bacterium]|nr:patatin-like phospholipase family protein [Bacillota bacterium]
MKRALVLSGGGSRGAFEVGAIDYLVNEEGMDFTYFMGTSAGALNASMLGQAGDHQELMDEVKKLKGIWLDIKGNRSIFSPNPWSYFRLIFKDALHEPRGLKKLIHENIDLNRVFDPASVVKITTVALETGELLVADSRQAQFKRDFFSYILASASVPLFFPPVYIQGKHWYDGGLRDLTPLSSAFAEEPEEIVVILTYPVNQDLSPKIRRAKAGGALNLLWRVVEILTNEVGANDLQVAELINQHHLVFPKKHCIPIRIIHPSSPLPGDPMEFYPQRIREQMRLGFYSATNPRIIRGMGKGQGKAV